MQIHFLSSRICGERCGLGALIKHWLRHRMCLVSTPEAEDEKWLWRVHQEKDSVVQDPADDCRILCEERGFTDPDRDGVGMNRKRAAACKVDQRRVLVYTPADVVDYGGEYMLTGLGAGQHQGLLAHCTSAPTLTWASQSHRPAVRVRM